MSSVKLMKDPFYAAIIFGIEKLIHQHDREASVALTDSDAKSAIRKAISQLKGKTPDKAPKNEKERSKMELAAKIVEYFEWKKEESGLKKSDFGKALLATEDSLKTRHSYHGHSRGYLDYLAEFLVQAETGVLF